jgi:hypothetical protein
VQIVIVDIALDAAQYTRAVAGMCARTHRKRSSEIQVRARSCRCDGCQASVPRKMQMEAMERSAGDTHLRFGVPLREVQCAGVRAECGRTGSSIGSA